MRNQDIMMHGITFKDYVKESDLYFHTKMGGFGDDVVHCRIERSIKVIYFIMNWYFTHKSGSVFFMSSNKITDELNELGCAITLKGVQYAIRIGVIEGTLIVSEDLTPKKCNGINHTREIRVNWSLAYKILGVGDKKDPFFSNLKAKSRIRKWARKRPFTSASALRKSFELLREQKNIGQRTEKALFKKFILENSAKYYSTESYTGESDNPEQIAYLNRMKKKPYSLELDVGMYKLIKENKLKDVPPAALYEYNRFGLVTPGNAFVFHLKEIMDKLSSAEFKALKEEISGAAA